MAGYLCKMLRVINCWVTILFAPNPSLLYLVRGVETFFKWLQGRVR